MLHNIHPGPFDPYTDRDINRQKQPENDRTGHKRTEKNRNRQKPKEMDCNRQKRKEIDREKLILSPIVQYFVSVFIQYISLLFQFDT